MHRNRSRGRQSMTQKSLQNSISKTSHRTNFVAGQAPIDIHTLTRVGLRGRKAWIVVGLFVFFGLLVVAELIWTCLILSMLRVDSTGIPALQFLADGGLRFSKPTEAGDVIAGGYVGAFQDSDLTLNGARDQNAQTDATVSLVSDHGTINKIPQRSELKVQHRDGIQISSAERFDVFAEVRAADGTLGRKSYLSVSKNSIRMPIPDRASSLQARTIITPKLYSMPDSELLITSDGGQDIDISSLAGLDAHAQEVLIGSGNGNIDLQASNGITLAAEGVLTVNTTRWTVANPTDRQTVAQALLCACTTRTGLTVLFQVASSPSRCGVASVDLPLACRP